MRLLVTSFILGLLAAATAPAAPAPAGPTGVRQTTLADLMLSNEKILNLLADLELNELLDYAFDKYRVPEEMRGAYKVWRSLEVLNRPDANLSAAKRREMVTNVCQGIDRIMQSQNDPRKLMQLATMLLQNGVIRDLNTLEYWGREHNQRVQAQLKPVAQTVSRVYARAAERAAIVAGEMANKITDPRDPRLAEVDRMSEMEALAKYNQAFNDYAVALAMDGADPQLAKVVDGAVGVLKEFDNPDSGVQNPVRVRMAKLYVAKGAGDEARKLFDAAIKDAKPAEEWGTLYEAKYFRVICDLEEKKLDAARTAIADLAQWQQTGIPADQEAARKGADAALKMLEYRLAHAEGATDPKAKERAIAILLKLLQDRPDLRSAIYVQLINQLPAEPDVKNLDPLLLRAMVANGEQEARKKADEMDKKVLSQALAATRELLSRKDVNLSKADMDSAALLLGLFHDLLGQDLQGAEAYLNYIEKFGASKPLVDLAMQNAEVLIARILKDEAKRASVPGISVYERFLELAVKPPFNRAEFAFELAVRQFDRNRRDIAALKQPAPAAKIDELNKRVAQTIEWLSRAAPADKRHFMARFYLMMAMVQKLDLMPKDTSAAPRVALVSEIQKIAEELDKGYTAQMAQAPDDAAKRNLRIVHVRTALTAAGLAMTEKRSEANNPQRAIELLSTFEEDVQGLPNADGLLGEASYVRFQAMMDLKREEEALRNLESYLERLPGDRRIAVVTELLEQFEKEFEAARRGNDAERAGKLSGYRARLSGRLVELARASENPEVKKHLDQYEAFDLKTKRGAAQLVQDPAEKTRLLTQVLGIYETKRAAAAKSRKADDPVLLGYDLQMALISFDLGDWVKCQVRLAPLVRDLKLGSARITERGADGTVQERDNPLYWEGMYKLMRSNIEISKTPGAVSDPKKLVDETKGKLMEFYTIWGTPGGDMWRDEFEQLRIDVLGADWKPKTLDDVATTKPAK